MSRQLPQNSSIARRILELPKINRSLTSQEPDQLSKSIRRIIANLNETKTWSSNIFQVLESWVSHEASHEATTSQLLTFAQRIDLRPRQALRVAHLFAALGLFEASLAFEDRALVRLAAIRRRAHTARSLTRAIRVAIHQGKRDDALVSAQAIVHLFPETADYSHSDLNLLNYVELWTNEKISNANHVIRVSDSKWSSKIIGRRVSIIGPGQFSQESPFIAAQDFVARMAGRGLSAWSSVGDPAEGRTDCIYLIPETLARIGITDEDRAMLLAAYGTICIKRGAAPYLQNARTVNSCSGLFIRGHPNLLPLACIDLLSYSPIELNVIASDFFWNASAYRPIVRVKGAEEKNLTDSGSNGNLFDRVTLFASHNVFQNRRLIKNLVEAGRVHGDKRFLSSVGASDASYARQLDCEYGKFKL